jgi:hypothetical protein
LAQKLFDELQERPISNIVTSSAVADSHMVEEHLSDTDAEVITGVQNLRQSLRLTLLPRQQRLRAYHRQRRRNLKCNWYHLRHHHGQHRRYLQQALRRHRLRPRNWYHLSPSSPPTTATQSRQQDAPACSIGMSHFAFELHKDQRPSTTMQSTTTETPTSHQQKHHHHFLAPPLWLARCPCLKAHPTAQHRYQNHRQQDSP